MRRGNCMEMTFTSDANYLAKVSIISDTPVNFSLIVAPACVSYNLNTIDRVVRVVAQLDEDTVCFDYVQEMNVLSQITKCWF